MDLFDKFIEEITDILPEGGKRFPYMRSDLKKADRNSILLLRDTAYELGGSQKPCVSTLAVTSGMRFDDSVYLFGRDICEIKEDCPFGKIVFLETEDMSEDRAFDEIKALESVRYNYCPEGFMTRASGVRMREQIRVSRAAVKKKISFSDLGSALIDEYRADPAVKSARIIFLTEFDRFDELSLLADKIKNTLSALNHVLDNFLFDCGSCDLKAICDEVAGMKELHMKRAGRAAPGV